MQVAVIRSNSSAHGKLIASDRCIRLVMTANAEVAIRSFMGRGLD